MKLIVSDFDLTLFDDNYDENIKLVNDFVDKGNIFVIATGRSYELLEKEIKNKNIKFTYLICSDGAVILDENLNILKQTVFDECINEIIDNLKKDTNLLSIDIDFNETGISGVYCIFNSIDYASKVLENIKHKYDVDGYATTHGINIINKGISKVKGVDYIKENLNIKDENIYTVGDNINDKEMINKYNGYWIKGKNINSVSNFKEFIEKVSGLIS